jgi:hypothetical protein
VALAARTQAVAAVVVLTVLVSAGQAAAALSLSVFLSLMRAQISVPSVAAVEHPATRQRQASRVTEQAVAAHQVALSHRMAEATATGVVESLVTVAVAVVSVKQVRDMLELGVRGRTTRVVAAALAALVLAEVAFLMAESVCRTISSARTSTGVVAAAVQVTPLVAATAVSVAAVREHSTLASVVTVSTGAVSVAAVQSLLPQILLVALAARTQAVAVAVALTLLVSAAQAAAVSS